MIRTLAIIIGIVSVSWFFYQIATSITKSPIITFSASVPVWLVLILSLGFFLYDAYNHIKKIKK
ncbi:MAG: hypothetical protein ACKO64_03165 [Candidatus Fonsibacter sp.]